jgi:voltage-gated potassium channel
MGYLTGPYLLAVNNLGLWNVIVKSVFFKLRVSLVAIATLFLIGTLGYVLIGGRDLFESFYVTVVVLTTVGMKETGLPLSLPEQWWTIFLMIAGIGTVLYATGNVVAFFVDGQIREVLGRRQLMKQINELQGHYIVVGFGRMGHALCATLSYKGVPFVLIDNSDEAAEEVGRLGYLYLHGDAMQEEILLMAGVDRAAGLATCLADDANNVFVTLTARSMNERLHIIARAEAIRTEAKLLHAGANRVICPVVMGAGMLTHLLLNPQVEEILELDGHWPDLEVTKLNIHRFPNSVGKPLKTLFNELDRRVMVVAKVSVDGTQKYNPSVDEILNDGDEIVVVGPAGSINQITHVLEKAA